MSLLNGNTQKHSSHKYASFADLDKAAAFSYEKDKSNKVESSFGSEKACYFECKNLKDEGNYNCDCEIKETHITLQSIDDEKFMNIAEKMIGDI